MTTNEAHAALRSALLTLIQIIELPLVAGVSLMAIFTERLEPRYLQYGLALLLVPMLLRLAVAGNVVAPTLTLWPLLLLVALGGLSIYVTPAWVYTWPELVRLLAGVALALAVINWLNPIAIGRSTPNQRVGAGRIIVATVVFLTLCGGLTVVGLLAMQATHKFLPALPWDGVARIKALTTTGTFNPNRVAGVAVLATPLVCALLLGSLRSDRPTVAGWLGWLVAKVAALLLSVGFGGALLLTESRGALLAAACALLALLPLLGRRGWLILLMVAVVGVALLSEVQPGDLDRFVIRDRRATAAQASSDSAWATILQDRNLQGRLILWRRALHGMADAPLTGMGLGAFEAVSRRALSAGGRFCAGPRHEPYPQYFATGWIGPGATGAAELCSALGDDRLLVAAAAPPQSARCAVAHVGRWSLRELCRLSALQHARCADAGVATGAGSLVLLWSLHWRRGAAADAGCRAPAL
ncbi:MAG: O-antigen ligase family protein [Caldilineaceae bacterium]